MKSLQFNSFLPSGAVEEPPLPSFPFPSHSSHSSSLKSPGSRSSQSPSASTPQANMPGPHAPTSHPSSSTIDEVRLAAEGYRKLSARLRDQTNGERAHMAADRQRMEEVMMEERLLWDKEREILLARIEELETRLKNSFPGSASPFASPLNAPRPSQRSHPSDQFLPYSSTGSTRSSSAYTVPQESGRNSDGSPFYAPASRNPSRTFEPSENDELRVDSISVPQETPLIITSKELTEADFRKVTSNNLHTKPESVAIDISHIQPELDGVPIKSTALAASFVAKVTSGHATPAVSRDSPGQSPLNVPQAPSDENTRPGEPRNRPVIAVIDQPLDKRLVMHAGHTPNQSISIKLDVEDGDSTPTQVQPEATEEAAENEESEQCESDEQVDHTTQAHQLELMPVILEEDPALSGPLSLNTTPREDDPTLNDLTSKLNAVFEMQETEQSSPSQDSLLSDIGNDQGRQIAADDTDVLGGDQRQRTDGDTDFPTLRLRRSVNFGRPFGQA